MTAVQHKEMTIQHIGGLKNVADLYGFFLLDIWGVLHDGLKPFSGTIECLRQLQRHNKKICLLSNTPHTAEIISSRLHDMGITRDLYHHILTAGESVRLSLLERHDDLHRNLGNRCYYMSEDPFVQKDKKRDGLIDGLGLTICAEMADAEFILNAYGGTPWEHVSSAEEKMHQARHYNLPMICANPDIFVNIGDQQYPCAGYFCRLYEDLGGTVIYHGKPHPPIYDMAWNLLGKPEKNCIVAIGDSLHTDIQGAALFGIDSLFHPAGIHRDEVALDHDSKNIDPEKIKRLVHAGKYRPTAILDHFAWQE